MPASPTLRSALGVVARLGVDAAACRQLRRIDENPCPDRVSRSRQAMDWLDEAGRSRLRSP